MRSKWKQLIWPLLLLPPLLIGVSLSCADQWVLPGNHDVIDAGGAERHVLQVDGRAVEYWVARTPTESSKGPKAFVFFLVGKGGRADQWINPVAWSWGNRPIEVWGMNYPGSGGSEGPPSLARVGPDALATFDAMKRVAGDRPIYLHAGSIGTTVALCVAARRPVAGVILQNPPPLKQLILGKYGWWNLWLVAGPVASHIPVELDSIHNAKLSTARAIFIVSDSDEVIPPRYHAMVVDAYAGPKRIIHMPGAAHNAPLPREAADQLKKELDWLCGPPR